MTKANFRTITTDDGTIVLISYTTPVAAFVPGVGFFRTATKYSVTTSKHINQWLASCGAKDVKETEQRNIDCLL